MKTDINDIINNARSIVITGHIKPDGDCVGSALGLYNYIEKNYPDIHTEVFLESPAKKLCFLKNFDKIDCEYGDREPFDLMICTDCASKERLGKAQKYFDEAKRTVCIDHHISNTLYAEENYIFGQASSASEVLCSFLDMTKLDKDIAICLYTGIIYDTGVFKYPLTSPETMRTAAALMEYGVPTDYIIDESFYAKTYDENRILGYAVMKSELRCGGKVIFSTLTKEEMDRFNITGRDLDGIVPQLRLTRGVICAFFLYELTPGEYKGSLRSEGEFNVNAIAQVFGGGGHVRASGFTIKGELSDCVDRILVEVEKTLSTYETGNN
ncbi:MAG: bifunctional oligoribonuclease/PAP phosphatase NrnA [Parasporobacterium sp.]|nr:bifunctional oligoribonuclease/PAP phosphatase NrnA [Parasporobacterium sp.]